MKTHKLASLIVLALFFVVIYPMTAAEAKKENVNLELKKELGVTLDTFGVVRYDNLKGPGAYGVGADAGYQFNKYVLGHLRLISYETDEWRGTAIDEGSLMAEAKLLRSANGKMSLSGTGGVHRDFDRDDWGFGIGVRGTAVIYKRLSAFAAGEIRAWFNREEDGLISAGLQLAL